MSAVVSSKPSSRGRVMRVDLEQLNREFGVQDVPADGNCLFSATAHSLARRRGRPLPRRRRERLARLLRRRSTDLLGGRRVPLAGTGQTGYQILRHHLGPRRSVPAYCRRLRSAGEWGGEPHLVALAHLLRRPLQVYDYHRGTTALRLSYGEGSPGRSLHLLRVGGNHYCALLPL